MLRFKVIVETHLFLVCVIKQRTGRITYHNQSVETECFEFESDLTSKTSEQVSLRVESAILVVAFSSGPRAIRSSNYSFIPT